MSEMTKKTVAAGLILIASASGVWAWQDRDPAVIRESRQAIQDPLPTEKTPSPFMQRKLSAAQEIMVGLAKEDYEKIAVNAQDLMLLSQESEWQVIQVEPYLKLSSGFRTAAERLRDAAKAKNLDGATLAYFDMTMNCVRCHKYLRHRKNNNE